MFLVHEKQLTDLKYTAQKMMFSIKDLSRKCEQFPRKLRIWSHLLEKSLMEHFNCCVVIGQRVSKIFGKDYPSETAFQRCSYEKVFRKYPVNLQENT